MKWWEISLFMFCTSFCHYTYIKSYLLIFKSQISKINLKKVIYILLITITTYYNTFYNYGFSKIAISGILMFLVLYTLYRQSIKEVFLKFIVLYLLGWIVELLTGILLAYFFINSVEQFDQAIIYKILFSAIMMSIILLLSHTKFIKKLINKIYGYMQKIFNVAVFIFLFIIALVLLTFYLIISNDILSYASTIFLILILSFLIIMLIIQSIKTKKADEKQEALLDFMKEYEIVMDKERIDRHEMVNNLLVLKSIKNKNTKQYDKILDDILITYKTQQSFKGLYDLPSGLKGLIYYKVYDMKNKDIEVFINISNAIIKDLEKLSAKELTKVCKILGILLDNAKEASEKSQDKIVLMDAYKEDKSLIIYIENTINTKEKIDLEQIKEKGFSTKGKNRGYGLHLINKIIIGSKKIELLQKVENNRFISEIKIKK